MPFLCRLLVLGRNKRMDRQNIHVNVLLIEGLFMIRDMFTWKKWDVLVERWSIGVVAQNTFGYCLLSRTDSNRNMLPTRERIRGYICHRIRSISRGPHLMNRNRAIIDHLGLKVRLWRNSWRAHIYCGNLEFARNAGQLDDCIEIIRMRNTYTYCVNGVNRYTM